MASPLPPPRRTPVLALAWGLLLVSGCRMDAPGHTADASPPAGQVLIGGVSWYVDYEAALEVAKAAHKALWVHFGENPG